MQAPASHCHRQPALSSLAKPDGGYEIVQIELVPDLSHCIETVAKREYRETVEKLLAAEEGNRELQEKVELLRVFLRTTDFRKLRAESEKHLIEGRKVKFVVYKEDGAPKYNLEVT